MLGVDYHPYANAGEYQLLYKYLRIATPTAWC